MRLEFRGSENQVGGEAAGQEVARRTGGKNEEREDERKLDKSFRHAMTSAWLRPFDQLRAGFARQPRRLSLCKFFS